MHVAENRNMIGMDINQFSNSSLGYFKTVITK